MRIIQFEKNKGRFEARIVGAKESTSNQILFVDDRIELREGYFEQLKALNAKVAMPNVIEVEDKIRPISLTLRLIRKRLYGKTWGADFEDYYIDQSNFERSPKGAAALWISKQSFLAACEEVAGDQGIGKYTNEDTRVLRVIVDAGEKILRSSKLVIYYRPRSTFKSETLHLYGRGPRFIDYYLRPGTRFFVPIIVFYLSLIALMALLIVSPSMFLLVIGTILLIAILLASYLASFGSQTLTVLVGLLLIVFAFGVGIIKGTWIALKS